MHLFKPCCQTVMRWRTLVIAISTLMATVSSRTALAAKDSWTSSTGGSWSDAGNWSLGALPTLDDDATFNLGSAGAGYTVTLAADASAHNVLFENDTVTLSLNGFNLLTRGGDGLGELDIAPAVGKSPVANVTLRGSNGGET